jgi:LmbE family N-acetylglucosaminyl deacetylase
VLWLTQRLNYPLNLKLFIPNRQGGMSFTMVIKNEVFWGLVFLVGSAGWINCQSTTSTPEPDDRYKADILLIIAHPDDESGDVAAYLARAIFDEHRRVAVICATRGDAGSSAVSSERAATLGAEREVEGRRALAFLGIENVWFLDASDTPVQDVLSSLEHWNHGSILEQVVRLVRLTRPEVILTWLPDYVAGENHADHQAAAVIATEAFDLAGDPTAFSEQISVPREDLNVTAEGLRTWQPQKIYFFSDAYDAQGYWLRNLPEPSPFRKNFLDGAGPSYSATDISPSRHASYAKLAAEETSFYVSQEGEIGKKALEAGDFKDFEHPVHFVLGKSVVGGSVTGNIFEQVTRSPVSFVRTPGFENHTFEGLALELGGSWAFYDEFWKAHQVEHLARLLPVPEVAIRKGGHLHVPLLLRNGTKSSQEMYLSSVLPEGWIDRTKHSVYLVAAGSNYTVEAVLDIPEKENRGWRQVRWNAISGGKQAGSVILRVSVVNSNEEGGLQQ